MFGAPFRKFKKILPFVLFLSVVIAIVFWKKHQNPNEKSNKYVNLRNFKEDYVDKRGIKVVVGHYIGNGNKQIPNATKEMLNSNNFNPIPNAGKNGNPVVVQPKDLLKMQQLFQINRFNLLVSDRIPLNRSLPDVRRKKCKYMYKDFKTYPKTSVIIVFHNEAWSTLLRTIWSVINRSPKELLEEIILVDDASEREFLKKPLEDYVENLPVKIQLLRLKERTGLVKARLYGAERSKGKVLTFLDAHCECTIGWLESLLARIAEDRKTVVCPVIDIINDDSFAYVKSFELHWGAFNWNLQFRWFTLGGNALQKRKLDTTRPFSTPAMAGGLFAIDKEYFFEIGSYDDGMRIWGGENLEMSFRVWQCGGKIEIVPCSHVGHLFRKSSPYTFPGGITKTLYSNLARVASVWMDEWANFYFKYNEAARKVKDEQDVTFRLLLRKNLNCKSFEWYLDNVWPQHFFPKKERFFGKIRHLSSGLCLVKPGGKFSSNQPTGLAKLEDCVKDDSSTIDLFVMTEDRFIMTDDSVCVDAPEKKKEGPSKVRIMACSGFGRQKWTYNNHTKELKHLTNELCLSTSPSKEFSEGLVIQNCNGSEDQKWNLEQILWS